MGFVSGSGYNKKNLGPLPSRSQKWIWSYLPLFFVKNCFFEIFDENKKHPPILPFFHKTPPSTSFQLWRDEKKCAKYYMMHVTLSKVYSPNISFKSPHQYLSLTKKKKLCLFVSHFLIMLHRPSFKRNYAQKYVLFCKNWFLLQYFELMHFFCPKLCCLNVCLRLCCKIFLYLTTYIVIWWLVY